MRKIFTMSTKLIVNDSDIGKAFRSKKRIKSHEKG